MDAETHPIVGQRIDLFGPSVEFLTPTSEAKGAFCVLESGWKPRNRGAVVVTREADGETPLMETTPRGEPPWMRGP